MISDSVAASAVPVATEDCYSEAAPQDQARSSLRCPSHWANTTDFHIDNEFTKAKKIRCSKVFSISYDWKRAKRYFRTEKSPVILWNCIYFFIIIYKIIITMIILL